MKPKRNEIRGAKERVEKRMEIYNEILLDLIT
jgi:hypothetical protein